MLFSGQGLKGVATNDLKLLLRAVHRDQLTCPITRQGLATVGALHLGDELAHLRGLDRKGVTAVLVAVIAERGPR